MCLFKAPTYYKYYIYNVSGLMRSKGFKGFKNIHFILNVLFILNEFTSFIISGRTMLNVSKLLNEIKNNNKQQENQIKNDAPNVQKALDSAIRTK